MTEEMKALTKEQILGANDRPIIEVEVKEWNGAVRLRSMTGKERDDFEAAVSAKTIGKRVDIRGLRTQLLSLCIVDEAGNLMFTQKDLEALGKKSAKAINDLFEAAQKVNGIGDDAVEELEKNLEGAPKDTSGSV